MHDNSMEEAPIVIADRVDLLKSVQFEGIIFNAGLTGSIVDISDGLFAVKFSAMPRAALIHGKYLRRIGSTNRG